MIRKTVLYMSCIVIGLTGVGCGVDRSSVPHGPQLGEMKISIGGVLK